MKKLITVTTLVVLSAVFFSSCKKDYTCTCMVDENQYIYDYSDQRKEEAEKACNAQDAAAKLVDTKGNCSLTKD